MRSFFSPYHLPTLVACLWSSFPLLRISQTLPLCSIHEQQLLYCQSVLKKIIPITSSFGYFTLSSSIKSYGSVFLAFQYSIHIIVPPLSYKYLLLSPGSGQWDLPPSFSCDFYQSASWIFPNISCAQFSFPSSFSALLSFFKIHIYTLSNTLSSQLPNFLFFNLCHLSVN